MADKIMTDGGLRSTLEIIRGIGSDRQEINASTIEAVADWQGKMICFKTACTVTVPSKLPENFSCGWSQESAGVVTFVAGSGETLQSFGAALKSSGQYAIGGIVGVGPATHRVYGQLVA
jgi:hypothetical protein